jgi:small subunit ribosomal protein S4
VARYIGPVCRLCRREGLKLFLKGERCYTEKCSFDRRAYAPGQHGQARKGKVSEFGRQLREKQKVKRMYGLVEKQFRHYYDLASKKQGVTGENLLRYLDIRLDNVMFRMGFSVSRSEARQLVRHSHVLVNGRKVNIPSYLVRQGDVIELREKSREHARVIEALDGVDRRGVPAWLEVERKALKGKVITLPQRADITAPIEERLIVELYSK